MKWSFSCKSIRLSLYNRDKTNWDPELRMTPEFWTGPLNLRRNVYIPNVKHSLKCCLYPCITYFSYNAL